MPPQLLDTSKKITSYVESLSFFIDGARITAVYPGGFSFKVKVPRWFKIIFSRVLRKEIQKKVSERMIIGVSFDFIIYSEDWF